MVYQHSPSACDRSYTLIPGSKKNHEHSSSVSPDLGNVSFPAAQVHALPATRIRPSVSFQPQNSYTTFGTVDQKPTDPSNQSAFTFSTFKCPTQKKLALVCEPCSQSSRPLRYPRTSDTRLKKLKKELKKQKAVLLRLKREVAAAEDEDLAWRKTLLNIEDLGKTLRFYEISSLEMYTALLLSCRVQFNTPGFKKIIN